MALACVPPVFSLGEVVSVAEDDRSKARNMAEQCLSSRLNVSVHTWRCCQLRKEHEGQHTDGLGCWP